jgi:hypothetical protein
MIALSSRYIYAISVTTYIASPWNFQNYQAGWPLCGVPEGYLNDLGNSLRSQNVLPASPWHGTSDDHLAFFRYILTVTPPGSWSYGGADDLVEIETFDPPDDKYEFIGGIVQSDPPHWIDGYDYILLGPGRFWDTKTYRGEGQYEIKYYKTLKRKSEYSSPGVVAPIAGLATVAALLLMTGASAPNNGAGRRRKF